MTIQLTLIMPKMQGNGTFSHWWASPIMGCFHRRNGKCWKLQNNYNSTTL